VTRPGGRISRRCMDALIQVPYSGYMAESNSKPPQRSA
jgi:hypothetical protein